MFSPHASDPRVSALKTALDARDPFYGGICPIPDCQRLLYYTHVDLVRRIDLSNTSAKDLDTLYRACKPAGFGRKMDLNSFATQFDPRSLGIHGQVSKGLLSEQHGMMDMELYKLNVYGKGDFFKAHKDTPRDQDMFGSLVVVLPTPHEGGQLVLRQDGKEWTIDFTDDFANAKGCSVCYVAFYSDVEHEVLPVTSGHRVTLTYNLYRIPGLPTTSPIPTPQHLSIKEALLALVNDKSVLSNGGYLGFGLVHDYVHMGCNILSTISGQLKGSDRALADVCNALGLHHTLRLFYRESEGWAEGYNIVTTQELDIVADARVEEDYPIEYLKDALERQKLTLQEAEVVKIGDEFDDEFTYELQQICRDPPTEVMEVTRMKSSVGSRSAFATHGNEASLNYFYGTACMLVAVDPAASRQFRAA